MRSLRVVAFLAVAVVVAVAAEGVEQVEEDFADQDEDVVDTVSATSVDSSSFQGRFFQTWSNKLWRWMGYEDYDYDEYHYYYYSSPSVGSVPPSIGGSPLVGGSPFVGGSLSSYSNYASLPTGHNKDYANPARVDKQESSWAVADIVFNVITAIVPIALLFQSMPTGLFGSVFGTSGLGGALKRRSFDQDNMLMDTLEPTQVTRIVSLLKSDLTDRRCQEELFCELSRIGEYEDASYLQKTFYYVSTLVPDFLAARYDLERLFRITRSGYCKALQCPSTSILEPPKIVHHPTDTNHISEVTTDTETEDLEVSNE